MDDKESKVQRPSQTFSYKADHKISHMNAVPNTTSNLASDQGFEDIFEMQFGVVLDDNQIETISTRFDRTKEDWKPEFLSETDYSTLKFARAQVQRDQIACVSLGSNRFMFAPLAGNLLDIYLKGNRITHFKDIKQISYDDQNLFMKKITNPDRNVKEKETYAFYSIDLQEAENICWDCAKLDEGMTDLTFESAKLNAALSYSNIYSSVNLIDDSIFVSHGELISKFSIIQNKFTAHQIFENEIKNVFRVRNVKKKEVKEEHHEDHKEDSKKTKKELQEVFVQTHNSLENQRHIFIGTSKNFMHSEEQHKKNIESLVAKAVKE